MSFSMDFPVENDELPVEYVPGTNLDFVQAIRGLKEQDRAVLSNVGGHFRWVVTKEDGTKVVMRPEESNEQHQDTN